MKRWIAVLLACALLCASAFAEPTVYTRELLVEGADAPVTESQYVSKFGYCVWVNESVFQAVATERECDMCFEAVDDSDTYVVLDVIDASWDDVRNELAALLAEYPAKSLDTETQYALGGDPDADDAAEADVYTGDDMEYFTRAATVDDRCIRFYLVKMPQGMLKIEAHYPKSAEDAYGERILELRGVIGLVRQVQ